AGLRVTGNATLELTNTIVSGHTYGILTTNASANVQTDHTLWDGNNADTGAAGGSSIVTTNDHYGDPDFAGGIDPFAAYHVQAGSTAIDAGIETGLTTDIDGQGRAPDIGADEFPYVLNLTPEYRQTVEADTVVVYTHTLRNSGGLTDTVELAATSGQSWSVQVQPLSAALSSGAVITVTLTVTVPMGSEGLADTSIITATSTTSPSILVEVQDVTIVGMGIQLKADNSQTMVPGTIVTYTHTLTNTGTTSDTIVLSLTSSRGWAELATTNPVTLAGGASTPVQVRVTVPLSAAAGVADTTVVTASSVSVPAVYDTAQDTTTASAITGTRY
ncbi:MAG: hypothetical protein GY832_43520, partial [Chloroflexi bacterium]|nr:hypothetical protein [Chloroflexota bacterium]